MKKDHWILRSNYYFDSWGDYKLLFLFGIIILGGLLEHFVFNSFGCGYAITMLPFIVWRLAASILSKQKRNKGV